MLHVHVHVRKSVHVHSKTFWNLFYMGQSETVKQQQSTVRISHNEDSTVSVIKGEGRRGQQPQKPRPQKDSSGNVQVCLRCRKSPPHGSAQCPAKNAVCHRCSKKGHFKRMCRSESTIGDISEDELAFLGPVTTKKGGQLWYVNLYLSNSLRLTQEP